MSSFSAGAEDGDFASMVQRVLTERIPFTRDRAWGVLSAITKSAKNRRQGPHIILTLEEHVIGRTVKEPIFLIDSVNVSGRHCTIFRKNSAEDGEPAVFIRDTSSNGTFVNSLKLTRGTEAPLNHGDIVSLSSVIVQGSAEPTFAYVYRDLTREPSTTEAPAAGASLKRKAAPLTDDGETKRTRVLGAGSDGPVNLADVRRLERNNQELRQKLEDECNKTDTLNADLRATKSLTDLKVKEARDHCTTEYSMKLTDAKRELSRKTQEFDECWAKCIEQQSVIEDVKKRLDTAAQSKVEAEEALQILKTDRFELEKQRDEERNLWKKEREELDATHKSALDSARASAAEELSRQADKFLRKQKQLEDQIGSLQETINESRNQLESSRARLEEERQSRMDFDKKAQELQIRLDREENVSANLRMELEQMQEKHERLLQELERHVVERDKFESRIKTMEVEMEQHLSRTELQQRRLDGAKERIMLRETQLRAMYGTAEQIAVLQKRQGEQLQAMMRAFADDAEDGLGLENLNAADAVKRKTADSQSNAQASKASSQATQQGENDRQTKSVNLNEHAPEAGEEETSMAATQMDDPLATQVIAPDNATQLVPSTQLVVPATQLIRAEEATQIMLSPVDEALGLRAPRRLSDESVQQGGTLERRNTGSICTADLLASEVAGSWLGATPCDTIRELVNLPMTPGSPPADVQQVASQVDDTSGNLQRLAAAAAAAAAPAPGAAAQGDNNDRNDVQASQNAPRRALLARMVQAQADEMVSDSDDEE